MGVVRCSACNRVIGPMLDKDGQPRLFLCPQTRRAAHMVSDRPYVVVKL